MVGSDDIVAFLQLKTASTTAALKMKASKPATATNRHTSRQPESTPRSTDKALLRDQLRRIASDIVGAHTTFGSPFGVKAMSYADFTASGKALRSIEDFIRQQVLPLYGNTHTTTSVTGLQTTSFREEARRIIADAVNARVDGPDAVDCVLFTGPGTTSAINKLIIALGLHKFDDNKRKKRPIVFVGPFEHHSNILPWRESGADVVTIPEDRNGFLNLYVLKRKLQEYRRRPLKIGSFSAASNITGLMTSTDEVTALLHQYGALSFWDYASCAPYVDIDMNPNKTSSASTSKDAVFLSGHKFIGGPGTPGVLIVKKKLLSDSVPTVPGGGTVLFVTDDHHQYLDNVIEREEGGTPDIVGSIRLGLAFQLKQRVGSTNIMNIERHHVKRVRESLGQNPNIVLLGRDDVMDHQLPIFSFLVRFGDRFLHYNFVCALLNDLFGVQTRGGCQCAGPYAARLLGLSNEDIAPIAHAVVNDSTAVKPGFSRMSFPYFMDDAEVDYILDAVHFVGCHGWKFLPLYTFDCKAGTWTHRKRVAANPASMSSSASDLQLQRLSYFALNADPPHPAPPSLATWEVACHRKANLELANKLVRRLSRRLVSACCSEKLDSSLEHLRWFAYPNEALEMLQAGERPLMNAEIAGPCQPHQYLIRDPGERVSIRSGSRSSSTRPQRLGRVFQRLSRA